MAKPGRGGRRGGLTLAQSPEQRKIIDMFTRKLQKGSKGIYKYGGDKATITEPVKFTKNEDGSVDYRVVGARLIPAQKSAVIGVGDEPAKVRTTISTGKITPGGVIKRNKNEVSEEKVRGRQHG